MTLTDPASLSPEATAFAEWYAGWFGSPTPDLQAGRDHVEAVHLRASEPEGVTYRDVDAGGVTAIWCEPIGSVTDYVLLHSHNGGTVVGSAYIDRKAAGHIAAAAGIPALVLNFRLAPEHKYPAQLDDVEAAFNWLVEQGYAPEKIIAIGHSVGGFLSPALAIRLRDKNLPMPGAIVSISPWCDLEIANESIVANATNDTTLSKELLEFFREAWIGGTDVAPDDVRINLNRSDLTGLPPTLVSWGTYEILSGEDEIFAEKLKEAGVDTAVLPCVGLQHSYVHGAGRVPEVDAAIREIASWVREKIGVVAQ